MTPDGYCWDRLDTDLRCAALMAPRRRRAAAVALMATWLEITAVPRTVTDAGVAARKLGWWQQELALMAAGQPRHPATRALARHLEQLPEAARRLDAVAGATLSELELQRTTSLGELQDLGARQAGPMLAMSAELLAAGDDAIASRTGAALKLLEVIRDTGWLARQDRLLLPREEMERAGVRPAEVLARQPGPGFDRLVVRLGRHAAAELADTFAAQCRAHRRAWKPARALAGIALARQRQIEAEPGAVLDARVDLTPVHKLWIAWRSA